MKGFIYFFIAFVFGCGSVYSVNFQDALDFSDESMRLIHKCAVDINKSESINLQPIDGTEGKYVDLDEFVVLSFPSEVSDNSEDKVAGFIPEKFSDRSVVLTGYRQGANLAAKIVDLLCNNSNFGRNQVKLITFCPADRVSENFDGISLINRLNFSHAFERVDFYGSNMLEIPISGISEVMSRVDIKDVFVQFVAWSLLGLSRVSENCSTLFSVIGVGLIGADLYRVSLRKLQYLPISGIVSAYRRAVNRSLTAVFEPELRESGYSWMTQCLLNLFERF